LVVVTLSACRVVVDTTVNKDGSGELRTSIVFSPEEKQNFESSPGNTGKGICDNLKKDVPPESTFFQEEKGNGETYCTTIRSFRTVKQLNDYYAGMGNVRVNELKLGSGTFVFDVQVNLTATDGNEASAHEWRLTIPGEIGSNNADVIENNTLIWNIEPGETRTLQAESAVGPRVLTQVLVGGLLVLLGMIFAVWLARKIAKRNEQREVYIRFVL
jgi:hypothetical protein